MWLIKNIIFAIAVFLMFVSAASAQGSIDGTITDAKGNGIANVTVSVVGANGKPVATAKTDADGVYTFDDIAAGKYKIAAYGAPGYDSAFRENVVVEDDDSATVDLTLAAYSPRGSKTQTKADWPTVKFAFEVVYDVGGKTYKFMAEEITGLGAETQPIEYKPGVSKVHSIEKMPGLNRAGQVTIKKGVFEGDTALWQSFQTRQSAMLGTITIKLLDDQSNAAMAWKLTNAFISKVDGTATLINFMTVEDEGLEILK
jgi:phage tail-like protein